MTTLCPICRTENSDTADYCSNCATSLDRADKGSGTEAATPPAAPIAARTAAAPPFPWRKAIVPALVLLGVLTAGLVLRKIVPRATDGVRTVAVLGFENLTGDRAYDYLGKAIPDLLVTSLGQSKYLDVTSWEQLDTREGREGTGIVASGGRDLRFEIGRREGVDAIVLGSFTKAENVFATDVKVYDVQTGSLLKSAGSRGDGIGSILTTQIDELSGEISRGVGLSERTAAKGAIPITKVTTASMEAYELFLKGRDEFDRFYHEDARLFFERAVEKDPKFALPYFYLVRVYNKLADAPRAANAIEQFKKLSKASPGKGKDNLYIAALSALIEADLDGYERGLKEVIEADPRDKRARADLAWLYKSQRKYAEAVAEFKKALSFDPSFGYALNLLAYTYTEMREVDKAIKTFYRYAAANPGDANPFDSMGDLYFQTGELDKARIRYQQALDIRPGFASTWKLSYLHALEGSYDEAVRWIDQLIAYAQTEGIKADGHQWKGFYYSLAGRFNEALGELGTAETLARASGNTRLADNVLWDTLWICHDWGRLDLYKTYLDKWLAPRAVSKPGTKNLGQIVELLYTGFLDVGTGDVAAAKKKHEEITTLTASAGQNEKNASACVLNFLKREILFAEGAYDEAIKLFGEDSPIEFNISLPGTVLQKNLPFQADFAARVLLKKGEMDMAIKEYERLVSPEPGPRDFTLIHPLSRFRLAALYEAEGDLDRAVEQYESLLETWKQADPGIPELATARKKLAELKAKTARPKGTMVEGFDPAGLYARIH